TPVLCAMILRNPHRYPRKKSPVTKFIDWFNSRFEKITGRYTKVLTRIVDRRVVTYGILVAFAIAIFAIDQTLPAGFIPNEDQGMVYAIIQTPPGSTLERTNQVSQELQTIAEEVEGIQS